MEFLFGKLKKMDVISVTDGKNLGKVCDLAFLFPENRIKGFFVTGSKGFRLTRSDVFIPFGDVVKIGEDAVLVKTGKEQKPCPPDRPCPPDKHCPPDRHCPPTDCPPDRHCPPPRPSVGDPRRNYDDYE